LQNYDQAGLLMVISGLINTYQPYVIRTLDPQPFEKPGPPFHTCPSQGYDVCFDNLDHTATARFVNKALSNYHGPNAAARYTVIHYKGYPNVA